MSVCTLTLRIGNWFKCGGWNGIHYYTVSHSFGVSWKNGVLSFQARQNATRVITNLSRQRVNSRLIAAEYLENNIDVINILIPG